MPSNHPLTAATFGCSTCSMKMDCGQDSLCNMGGAEAGLAQQLIEKQGKQNRYIPAEEEVLCRNRYALHAARKRCAPVRTCLLTPATPNPNQIR